MNLTDVVDVVDVVAVLAAVEIAPRYSRRPALRSPELRGGLLARGPQYCAKKLGEEAVETVIEGVAGDQDRLVSESADLLYHLLVLWAARGVRPAEVWAALEARRGVSGITEKAARTKD